MATSALFASLKLRSLTLPHRILMSPMCQYSCKEFDGIPNDWHFVHLVSRAIGKVAVIIAEATAVVPEGRISPADTGLWNDAQTHAWKRITTAIKEHGSIPAIQLAHAGRKASTFEPWAARGGQVPVTEGGWDPVAPSAVPFSASDRMPHELSESEIDQVVKAFEASTLRALDAGFQIVEIHNAHGYLLHEFLSPLSNKRTDAYGGSLENRMKLPLRIAAAVRSLWPDHLPVFVRISATDWMESGWDVEQSIAFCRELKAIGIDLIDVSSGGAVPEAKVAVGPGYQVPFAKAIRDAVGIPTGAVGLISTAKQAEEVVASESADVVLLARPLLRDPHWVLRAAHDLRVDLPWPQQYDRAKVGYDRPF